MGENNKDKADGVKNGFDTAFKIGKRQRIKDISRKVYGDEFIEELDSNSFVTKTDLQNFVRFLKVEPNEMIIDVGCGRGGPGMWIARETGANYFGYDLSEVGIEIASSRAKDFGLEGKVQFKVGDICATAFPDNYFDAAISIDVLVYIPEVSVAISEVSRILHSEAKFLFTTWEKKRPSKLNDYRLFLRNAGFKIEAYNETPDWERLQREFYQLVLDNKEMLIKDMGKEESSPFIIEAESIISVLKYLRRIFVVAEKI